MKEYVLYDAVGGLLELRLQGHVLRGGAYRAMEPEDLLNGERGGSLSRLPGAFSTR